MGTRATGGTARACSSATCSASTSPAGCSTRWRGAAPLTAGGKLAVLIGDGKHDGRYLALPFRLMSAAAKEGFWLAAPEIIRFGHGATSSRKPYTTAFIPRLHDVCLVLEPVE